MKSNDSKFHWLWVLVWQPLCFMLFLVVMPYVASAGSFSITGALFLVYLYISFAPAIYWVLFRRQA
jgi:hypothetical protein